MKLTISIKVSITADFCTITLLPLTRWALRETSPNFFGASYTHYSGKLLWCYGRVNGFHRHMVPRCLCVVISILFVCLSSGLSTCSVTNLYMLNHVLSCATWGCENTRTLTELPRKNSAPATLCWYKSKDHPQEWEGAWAFTEPLRRNTANSHSC